MCFYWFLNLFCTTSDIPEDILRSLGIDMEKLGNKYEEEKELEDEEEKEIKEIATKEEEE